MFSEITQKAYIANCIESLQRYEIDEPVIQRRSYTLGINSGDAVQAPDRASIVGEGILSFTGGLSEENQSDAQNAYLYASLVANKRYPLEREGKEWYELFREVMTNAGWMPISKYYSELEVGGTSVRMDKLVLEILGSVIAGVAAPGPTTALMLKVAGDAINALQKRDTALTLYERNLLNNGIAGVTAAACTEVNGEATMAMGAVRFLRGNSSTKVLFVDVDIRNVNLYRGETVFTKNKLVAAAVRDTIRSRLGLNAVSKIEAYEI